MSAAYFHLGYMEEALIEMNKGRRLRGGDVIEPIRIEALVALFQRKLRRRLWLTFKRSVGCSSQAIGDTVTWCSRHYYYGKRRTRADDARVV